MPVRAVISPKFTYDQGKGSLWVRLTYGSTYNNGMFYNAFSESYPSIFLPPFQYPELGNLHTQRKGNRITITSLRVKLQFRMNEVLLRKWNIWDTEKTYTDMFTNGFKLPLNQQLYFKMRLFLLKVDDDIDMTNEQKFLNWFAATYCYYRAPTTTPADEGPQSILPSTPGPISVHSNVLRLTTPWTGKFNILVDKKFTVKGTRPQFGLDMTIPLKQEFVFKEGANDLLYPKYHLFLVGPQSFEVDQDVPDSAFTEAPSGIKNMKLFDIYSWTKLNFVDL